MTHIGGSIGSPLLVPGDVLASRYRILGPVGNGGLAWVWEALDLWRSSRVAIKHFKQGVDAPVAELARREAELLGCILHRGIPRLLGRGKAFGVPYLVLELVRGWNLQEVYEHRVGPLTPEKPSPRKPRPDKPGHEKPLRPGIMADHTPCVGNGRWPDPGRFAFRLAAIVAALHEHGLVHRDINLQNVMTRKCRDGWEPVVVDLGLGCARSGNPARWGSRLAGNLRTLAPEQIERRAIGHDPRTDVYQFGLVFYRLLTGVDAFAGSDLLVERILAGDFRCPSEVDPDVDRRLEDICVRALARDPSRRPANARQVRESIGRALTPTGSPVAAGAPAGARTARRPPAARPGGWRAVAGT